RDAQHRSPAQAHLVVPQGIVHRGQTLLVLHPVDLHTDLQLLPPHVQVDPASRSTADPLPGRLREAVLTAQPGEVELPQRLYPAGDLPEQVLQQLPATDTPPAAHLPGQ